MPLPPATTASHDESLAAVHAHAESDGMTVNEPLPPPAGKLPLSGINVKLHVPPPACVIAASANPPLHDTRILPVRALIVEFAATVYEMIPGAVPDVAPSVIHGVDVEAVHEHALGLFAMKLKLPPLAGTF